MKKINLIKTTLLFFLVCWTVNINAQSFEISPFYGYQFGTKLNYGPNYIQIGDSDQYGVTLGFETFDDFMIEVSYFRQSTDIRIKDVILSPRETRLADLSADWVMIGGTHYFSSEKLRPFAGGSLGLAFLSPDNENRDLIRRPLDSETKFSFAFKAGVNYMFTDSIGLSFRGDLLFPVNWGGVYVGGGPGGAGAGVGVSSTTVIGSLSAGLVYRIN